MAKTSICVFCGSRSGIDPAYETAATQLGKAIVAENWRLVYGAGDVGLMGATARATQDAGGETFGVIPTHLLKREVGKTDLTQFVVTENMHERKKVMFMNSNAIVVLPGGAGSLDEFFEILTWRQLGLHENPIILCNINQYWQPLIDLVDHVVAQGFADPSLKGYFQVCETIAETTQALKTKFS
ncbi:TIGR00730 family Rossman fold protein [Cognatishimia sp. WU-CL00825]|uniref:LOG family protein n=1 Tax=Cognatishimia sp. WU-CL00825 TaxID=3127658 RepID=UPI00310768E1